jgi:hypothetical protein
MRPDRRRRKFMAEIHGTFSEEFVGVREALAKNLDSGADIGSSAAVLIDD